MQSQTPYTTLAQPHSYSLEVKHSRFLAHAAPVTSSEEALDYLQAVRDPEATHNCWAYKVGTHYRFSDDGEPGGTAGQPILRAIEGQGMDGVMVLVTRHYGGINLGTGGLMRAYGGVAAECLRMAPKRQVVPMVRLCLEVPFELTNTVFHLLEGLTRESEDYTSEGLRVVVRLEQSRAEAFATRLRDQTRGRAKLTFI